MREQRPSKQPQRFTSVVPHSRIMVHMVPGVWGLLFALATHAGAWQGSEGPQSASLTQASSLFFGAGSRHAGGAFDAEAEGLGVSAAVAGAVGVGAVAEEAGGLGSLQHTAEIARAARERRAWMGFMVVSELEAELEGAEVLARQAVANRVVEGVAGEEDAALGADLEEGAGV